jgi:Flp pilus assembly protein TadG
MPEDHAMNASRNRSTTRFPRLRARPARRGAEAVEVAFVLPALVLLLFGAIEFYRLKMVQHTADIAAYAAARRVVVMGATAAEGQAKGLEMCTVSGVRGATVTVTPDPILNATTEVTASVAVPLRQNSWIGAWVNGTDQVRRSITLRTERVTN